MLKPTQGQIDRCLAILAGNSTETIDDITTDPELNNALRRFTGGWPIIDNLDLSEIKMDYKGLMTGQYKHFSKDIVIWTDNVKWPSPEEIGFDPQKILDDNKHPTEMDEVHKIATGKNIGIAILDMILNLENSEYKENIKKYEKIGFWPSDHFEFHAGLVTGLACGKTTGTAPDADLYYIATNNRVPKEEKFKKLFLATAKLFKPDLDSDTTLKLGHRIFYNAAIKRILEINKELPESKKIRFLSISIGAIEDQFHDETMRLCQECEKNGIMVIGALYKERLPNYLFTVNKNMKDTINPKKTREVVGVPVDGKTSVYNSGGYMYSRWGGASSIPPYVAGVFACACQDNELFFTRQNWQDELMEILKATATTNQKTGDLTINPLGIRNAVTQRVHEMEMNLIQQKRKQHE